MLVVVPCETQIYLSIKQWDIYMAQLLRYFKTSEILVSDCNWNFKKLVVTDGHKWLVSAPDNLSETIVMLWHLGIMNCGHLYT